MTSRSVAQAGAASKTAEWTRRVVAGAVVLAIVAVAALGGAVFGPRYFPRIDAPAAQALEEAESTGTDDAAEDDVATDPDKLPDEVSLEGLVVDVRSESGELHHLKVTTTVELGDGVTEDDLKKLIPRGRDAEIEYLRSLDYDDLAFSSRFLPVRQELTARVRKAMGRRRIRRLLFTDFVLQ